MDGLTTDRNDPRLPERRGPDESPVGQQEVYLVLSDEERAKGWVRPYRDTYKHLTCGNTTTMGRAIAETWATNIHFYGGTYCVHCQMHRPVAEFVWLDGSQVGS